MHPPSKYKWLFFGLMALATFNYLIHLFIGIALPAECTGNVEFLNCPLWNYLATVKIQLIVCFFILGALIIRRIGAFVGVFSKETLEDFSLTLSGAAMSGAMAVYVFSNSFLQTWTTQRPPWIFAAMIGLLTMASLGALFACLIQPGFTRSFRDHSRKK